MLDQDPQTQPETDLEKAEDREVNTGRTALIKNWCAKINAAETYWDKRLFDRIRYDRLFVMGYQWQQAKELLQNAGPLPLDERQVVNITQRHIKQQVATLYGKDPRIVCRHKDRMVLKLWDGTQTMVDEAMMMARSAMAAAQSGAPMTPEDQQFIRHQAMQAQQILAEVSQYKVHKQRARAIAKTVEMVMDHCISEQPYNFKQKMKDMVRRALVCGLAHVKITYNKIWEPVPDKLRELERVKSQLAAIERMSKDVAEGELDPLNDAGGEELKNRLAQLNEEVEALVYEGLTFEYPDPTMLIFDPQMTNWRSHEGAMWVAEKEYKRRSQIRDEYGIDVKGQGKEYSVKQVYGGLGNEGDATDAFAAYTQAAHHDVGDTAGSVGDDTSSPSSSMTDAYYCVYTVYDRSTGVTFKICEGVDDYISPPKAPDFAQEKFFPYHTLVFNEIDGQDEVTPLSETHLIRPMQHEINSAAEGLLEHRIANRPGTMSRKGALDAQSKRNLSNRKAHENIEVNANDNDLALEKLLSPIPTNGIDPNLYETNTAYQNILRVVGSQEAEFGGTSGSTATEAAIAQGARSTASGSDVDALDEFLSELMRVGGQLVLSNMERETVMKIAGETAVWPELSREEINREFYMEIEAGSTGKPNQAAEIQNMQALAPFIYQLPGISPEYMARRMVRLLGDDVDLSEAIAAGQPSIQAMNAAAQSPGMPSQPKSGGAAQTGDPSAPQMQGQQGLQNQPSTQPDQVNSAPRPDNAQGIANQGGFAA
jgi:hypothetical protein